MSDSGDIFDSTLQGGRLGVFAFSQEAIYWSNLVYRCNEAVPKMIYDGLPGNLKALTEIDTSRTSEMVQDNIIGNHTWMYT